VFERRNAAPAAFAKRRLQPLFFADRLAPVRSGRSAPLDDLLQFVQRAGRFFLSCGHSLLTTYGFSLFA
jgi:hypothetical protein